MKAVTKTLKISDDHVEQALINYLRPMFKEGEVIGTHLRYETKKKGWEVDVTVSPSKV